MAEYKLVISDPKSGKSLQKEVKDDDAKHFKGLKVGQTVKGELLDLPGYEFLITGGSDAAGFPMRKDVSGAGRVQIFSFRGIGIHNKKRKPNPKKKGWRTMKGMRRKKTVAGNTIHDKTAQINLKITKAGSQSLFEAAADAPATDTPKTEAPKEAPKKEPKPEVKEETKPEPKKEKKEEPVVENKEVAEKKPTEKPAPEKEKTPEDKEIKEIEKKVEKDEKKIKELDDEEKKVEEELNKADSEEKEE